MENLGGFQDRHSNTLILGNFNTPLSTMDRSTKQNNNKDIVALKNALYEMELTDIYRTFTAKQQNICSFQRHMEDFQR